MADALFDTEHREPLFDDDTDYPASSWGIAMKLRAIARYEKLIEERSKQYAEASTWYRNSIARLQERQNQLRQEVRQYLIDGNEDNIPTPHGTAFLQTTQAITLPDHPELLEWANNSPQGKRYVDTVYEVDVSTLKEDIKKGVVHVPGATTETVTRLAIRGLKE